MSMFKKRQDDSESEFKLSFDKSQSKTDCGKVGNKKQGRGIYPSKGAWTPMEQISYFNFIIENAQLMNSSKMRKKLRMFKKMGEVVGTRGTVQCKSHHQKMLISHENNLKRLLEYGKDAYLCESVVGKSGRIKRVQAYLESQTLFYRMYRSGSNIKIIINEQCINSYQ